MSLFRKRGERAAPPYWIWLSALAVLAHGGCAARVPPASAERVATPPVAGRSADPDAVLTGTAVTTETAVQCGERRAEVRCVQDVSVSPATLGDAVSSLALADEQLRVAGSDSASWIALATRAAGTSVGTTRVYIDGIEAPSTIPTASVARIRVNADPFSAEFGGVEQLRVDIDSRAPERRWRFDTSLPSLSAGARSLLAAGSPAATRVLAGGLTAPVPRVPLTVSLHGSLRRDTRGTLLALPDGTAATLPEDLRPTTDDRSVIGRASWSTPRVAAALDVTRTRSHARNPGVGDINAVFGEQLSSDGSHVRGSWRVLGNSLVHRGGLFVADSRLRVNGRSDAPHTVYPGQAVQGGSDVSGSDYLSQRWTVKHTIDAPAASPAWKVGIDVERSHVTDRRRWNPLGRVQFDPRAGTGTWLRSPEATVAAASTTIATAFAEATPVRRRNRLLRTGIRAEWQQREGLLVSPRASAAAALRGTQFSGGAGLFVEPIAADTLAAAHLRGEAAGFTLVRGITSPEILRADAPGDPLGTEVATSFRRRRDVVGALGIQRRDGPVQWGVERKWTWGAALPGSVRKQRGGGRLRDILDSDRTLRRTQTHVRANVVWKGHSISVRYEHVSSSDDTDGPFTLPAIQDDVSAEWAPSSGIPRHTASVFAQSTLPGGVRVVATFETRIGKRYGILSGTDDEGLGTFSSRSGHARNAGVLPATRIASLYAARQFRVKALRGTAVDVGGRIENLTNRTNVFSVGRVLGTPWFGRPLSAAPGRAIHVWVALAR